MSLSPCTTAAYKGHLFFRGQEGPAWDASAAYFRCMYGHSLAFPSFSLEPQERTDEVKRERRRMRIKERILHSCSIRDRKRERVNGGYWVPGFGRLAGDGGRPSGSQMKAQYYSDFSRNSKSSYLGSK